MQKPGIETGALLRAIGAAGGAIALTVAVATMPGIAVALMPFLKKESYQQKRLVNSLSYLKRSEQIQMREDHGKVTLTLTQIGQSRLLSYRVNELAIRTPVRWDRQWRLVIFDVPVERKIARDMLRGRLKLMGFHQLQESVWIHPFPCQDEIEFLASLYEIRPYVKVLTVSALPEQEKRKLERSYSLP